MARMDEYFRYLKDNGGSDLHLGTGLAPRIRRKGSLEDVEGKSPLGEEELLAMMEEIAEEAQWAHYRETLDLDFAYSLDGVGRFRANFFRQERGAAAVFRLIPEEIIPLSKLGAPDAIHQLAHLERGLVLVTGPTGSGKSTTMAAVINEVNETYVKHVVTIEDPVEFVHTNKKSVFSHREVGRDTGSFAAAMRAAVRQDPDIVVVGEMRDVDTISMALAAAEMGVLVFGTLHTNSATKTIDRLIDAFPTSQHEQVRLSLADSLAAVVSQLLLPTADGAGRVAAHEILLSAQGLPNIIRQGNTTMLSSVIQSGKARGMQAMDDALFGLMKEGKVTPRDAYMKAFDKQRFEPALES